MFVFICINTLPVHYYIFVVFCFEGNWCSFSVIIEAPWWVARILGEVRLGCVAL